MHIDWLVVLGGSVVGFLVGMTGTGGGALMTPMLVFLFGVAPSAAISSDLVATLFMRPVGAAVHLGRRTVDLRLVGLLASGSVPGAVLGALALHLLGSTAGVERAVDVVLGAALLAGAAAMLLRALGRRRRPGGAGGGQGVGRRGPATVAVGALGGFLVGLTSVGAGSLMVVLLLFVYPSLGAAELVGTDLVQAVPLSAAAALGQLLFGHVVVSVTASLVLGSVPAVLAGSLLSSRAPEHVVRPVLAAAVTLAGLRDVGVGTDGLGVAALCAVAGCVAWVLGARRLGGPRVQAGPAVRGCGVTEGGL